MLAAVAARQAARRPGRPIRALVRLSETAFCTGREGPAVFVGSWLADCLLEKLVFPDDEYVV